MAKKSSKNWIKGAVKHPGALTETAKRHHMSLGEFIAHPPKGISDTTKRRISLAKTLRKMN